LNSDNFKSTRRSGRPKAINNEDKEVLKDIIRRGNKHSADKIRENFNERTGKEVCTKTICRGLHELGIFSQVAAVKPLLTDKQRENQLQ